MHFLPVFRDYSLVISSSNTRRLKGQARSHCMTKMLWFYLLVLLWLDSPTTCFCSAYIYIGVFLRRFFSDCRTSKGHFYIFKPHRPGTCFVVCLMEKNKNVSLPLPCKIFHLLNPMLIWMLISKRIAKPVRKTWKNVSDSSLDWSNGMSPSLATCIIPWQGRSSRLTKFLYHPILFHWSCQTTPLVSGNTMPCSVRKD